MEQRKRLTPQMAGGLASAAVLLLAVLALAAFVVRDAEEERITGEAAVDAIIGAVERQDISALLDRVMYLETPCSLAPLPDPVTNIEPPSCPAGAADSTMIPVFMTGSCESRWVTAEGVLATFAERLSDPQQVYAVVRMETPYNFIVAQYRIVFGRPGELAFPFSGHIAVFDGAIVQLATWCDGVREQFLTLEAAGGEPLFVSPDLEIESPIQAGGS